MSSPKSKHQLAAEASRKSNKSTSVKGQLTSAQKRQREADALKAKKKKAPTTAAIKGDGLFGWGGNGGKSTKTKVKEQKLKTALAKNKKPRDPVKPIKKITKELGEKTSPTALKPKGTPISRAKKQLASAGSAPSTRTKSAAKKSTAATRPRKRDRRAVMGRDGNGFRQGK